jgi:hypothetical protein
MRGFSYKSPKDKEYVERAFSRFDEIMIYNNVLPKDLFVKTVNLINSTPWTYGRQSTPTDRLHFWSQNLTQIDLFSKDIFKYIEDLLKRKFKIHSIVSNGQTFGQDGEPHFDTTSDGDISHTFLLYLTPCTIPFNHPAGLDLIKWNPAAGGKTIFIENIADKGIQTKCVDSIPNSAVLFPADMVHYGECYHRNFGQLRITIAYKLIIDNE